MGSHQPSPAVAFDTDLEGLIPTIAKLMDRRIEPKLVSDGPVKEVVQTGDQVNLQEIPAHIAGSRDAGPFLSRRGWQSRAIPTPAAATSASIDSR